MNVRVGIIGIGLIGVDHARRLTDTMGGVDVTAVADIYPARAKALANTLPMALVHATGEGSLRPPTSMRLSLPRGARLTKNTSWQLSLRTNPCSAKSRLRRPPAAVFLYDRDVYELARR